MSETVLLTGGAGFIGSHTADLLLQQGHAVRAFDLLSPQVHPDRQRPSYLHPDVELVEGDVRDVEALVRALDGVDVVYHLAAETGVGQSMYESARYFDVNVTGTAALWEAIQRSRQSVRRVILSSSRAVYGEGVFQCARCGQVVNPDQRSVIQLEAAQWAPKCPTCGGELDPIPVSEGSPLNPVSVYGQTKLMQEQVCELMAHTLGVEYVGLRYFNVYGPRQALGNPYTGVIGTFYLRARAGREIPLYEEGTPLRDFVNVQDVALANLLAMSSTETSATYNVGSGGWTSIGDLARIVAATQAGEVPVTTTRKFRVGDVYAVVADPSHAQDGLQFEAQVPIEDGVVALVRGLDQLQDVPEDRSSDVEQELAASGFLGHSR
jgi:dTDP-L-rhamnose 4-epimerase